MDFISWSVFGILFILAESAIGTSYLMAIGLAFAYPAIADYAGLSGGLQYAAFVLGSVVHTLFVMLLRKRSGGTSDAPTDVGQRVEVIEWIDDGTARVRYLDKEWLADKAASEMPDAEHGIIKSVQYGRLVITTE
ncbi:MAG: NfeD family protein [Gallionella sp.]|nr:NfeD family protein [Gallionella sp.]